MSFIGDDSGGEDAAARTSSDLRKPFLHTGSWYRMATMGSRLSSLMDKFSSSAAVIRDSALSVVLCTLIVALGPVQFGFTCGLYAFWNFCYSRPWPHALRESPRWLAKLGMMEDFETSLQVLRGFDTDITLELNEIKRSVASSSRRTTIHFSDLKKRRFKVPLMIGIGLLVLQLLSGMNAILFYSSNIFKAAGLSSSNIATCGVGVIQISSSGITVSLLLVSVAFYLKDVTSEDSKLYFVLSMLSLVGLVAFVISFCLGLGAIPWIIMSEDSVKRVDTKEV